MPKFHTPIIAVTLWLAACATQQENPNYAHSTTFKGHSPYAATQPVQNASYPSVFADAPVIPSYSTVSPDCVDGSQACQPAQTLITTTPDVAIAWASPTETQMPTDTIGTPGYQAVGDETASLATASPVRAAGSYIQPDPVYSPDYGAMTYGDPDTIRHGVVEGDTVYSLARRHCTDVDTIARLNGLDADYGIAVGQSLRVPVSC